MKSQIVITIDTDTVTEEVKYTAQRTVGENVQEHSIVLPDGIEDFPEPNKTEMVVSSYLIKQILEVDLLLSSMSVVEDKTPQDESETP